MCPQWWTLSPSLRAKKMDDWPLSRKDTVFAKKDTVVYQGRRLLPAPTPEPQVLVRKFLFPNLVGSKPGPSPSPPPATVAALTAAKDTTSHTAAKVSSAPRPATTTANAFSKVPIPPVSKPVARNTSSPNYMPLAPKADESAHYFLVNSDGSAVSLLSVNDGPVDPTKPPKLMLKRNVAPVMTTANVTVPAVTATSGNVKLQLHPVTSADANILLQPKASPAVINGVVASSGLKATSPRPVLIQNVGDGAGKTLILQGNPSAGKQVILKNTELRKLMLQPGGGVGASGSGGGITPMSVPPGAKTVFIKGLSTASSGEGKRTLLLQPQENGGGAVVTNPAKSPDKTGTLHLELVVNRKFPKIAPAPTVTTSTTGTRPSASVSLPPSPGGSLITVPPPRSLGSPMFSPSDCPKPGPRLVKLPARDLEVCEASCQTELCSLIGADSMLQVTLDEVPGATTPDASPTLTFSAMPPADTGTGSKRDSPFQGDTGPPAKRPRTESVERDVLKLRLYAFKDWLTCTMTDNEGNLPLHCAVIVGDVNQVKRQCYMLNARSGSLDIPNFDGETPLHLAIIHHHPTMVQLLIKFGARPQFRDRNGNTAFHLACQRDVESPGILRSLLAAPGITPYDLDAINDNGYSPLHLCAMYDKVQELEALISRDADVNVKDAKSGRTPLFHAVEHNASLCCRVLLSHGANSMEQNFAGHTPIIAASEFTSKYHTEDPLVSPHQECLERTRTLRSYTKV